MMINGVPTETIAMIHGRWRWNKNDSTIAHPTAANSVQIGQEQPTKLKKVNETRSRTGRTERCTFKEKTTTKITIFGTFVLESSIYTM